MQTLIELLAEQRLPRQDQAPLAPPAPPRPQVPLEEQQRAHVMDDTRGHVRVQRERFSKVPIGGRVGGPPKDQGRGVGCESKAKPRLRVNRSWVAYQDVRDQEKVCGHDRRLEKCSGRFRKHLHMIWVRKPLSPTGHCRSLCVLLDVIVAFVSYRLM